MPLKVRNQLRQGGAAGAMRAAKPRLIPDPVLEGNSMRLLISAAAAAIALAASTSAFAADPYGTWTRPSTGAQISFYDCGGKLCGKVVSVKDQTKKDAVGKVIMTGATKSSDNTWKGDVLNLDDGKTYSGVVTLEGPKALNLKGCALGGLVCKGETLTR
jgi:uncharacterized protein (DUF2147 family)